MFSYYGSKSKIVDYYPPPKYKQIIEPFAGSARYSLKYWQNDITLVDKYEVIVKLWKWLQQCSTNDIMGLPDLFRHDDIRNFNICDDAKLLIGFCINRGSIAPKNIVADFHDWNGNKKQIAKNLHKIKHWKIINGSYDEINNVECTWFVDPPYMFGGEHYKEPSTNLDFTKLAEWCKTRNGQVIVCENTKATWLPFKPMKEMKGCVYKTTEAIWSNHKTNHDAVQQSLWV